jgi:hypothetical protein
MRRAKTWRDDATPPWLPTFLAGTLVMVGAVIAIGAIDSDWADFGALALLLVILGVLLSEILRRIRRDDEEQ